jgi:hypothetical protein
LESAKEVIPHEREMKSSSRSGEWQHQKKKLKQPPQLEFNGSDEWAYDRGCKDGGKPGAVYRCVKEGCQRRIKVRFFNRAKSVRTPGGRKEASEGFYIVAYKKQAGGHLAYPEQQFDYKHNRSYHSHQEALMEVVHQDTEVQQVDYSMLTVQEEERVWARFGKAAEALFPVLAPVGVWKSLFHMHGAVDAESGIRIPPHGLIVKKKQAWTSQNNRHTDDKEKLEHELTGCHDISAQNVKGMCTIQY